MALQLPTGRPLFLDGGMGTQLQARGLAAGEIPSCFFNVVSTSRTPRGYRMEDFAEFVLAVSRR